MRVSININKCAVTVLKSHFFLPKSANYFNFKAFCIHWKVVFFPNGKMLHILQLKSNICISCIFKKEFIHHNLTLNTTKLPVLSQIRLSNLFVCSCGQLWFITVIYFVGHIFTVLDVCIGCRSKSFQGPLIVPEPHVLQP